MPPVEDSASRRQELPDKETPNVDPEDCLRTNVARLAGARDRNGLLLVSRAGAIAVSSAGHRSRSNPSPPPGPRGHWLAGNLAAYERDRLEFVRNAHARFGNIVRFDKRTTLVADPELITLILRSPRAGITHDVLLRPVDPQRAHTLAAVRELMYPGARKTVATRLASLVTAEIDAAIAVLDCDPDGHILASDPMAFTEEVISKAVNTYWLGHDGPSIAPLVRGLLDDLSELIGNPLAPPASWPTPLRRRIENVHAGIAHSIESVLIERRKCPGADLVTDVVAHPNADQFDDKSIADMIVGSLLAAQRVPAAAAAWMLHLLATHSHAQRRIRAEAIPGNTARQFARAVALESSRLYPATWMLQRTVLGPIEIGGHVFQAGHHLLMSPFVVQRSALYFERPDEFVPERWLEQGARSAKSGFLPFGDGLHICPGRHLALQALATVADHLCRSFDLVELGTKVTADPRTTLTPRGSMLQLRPASDRSVDS